MRILVISSLLLFKETRYGGAKRLYSFVYELSRFADVHTICLDASGEAPDFEKSGECLQNFLFLPQCHPPLPAPYKFFYSPIDFQQLVRKNRLSIDRFPTIVRSMPCCSHIRLPSVFCAFPRYRRSTGLFIS